ncbi:mucin-4 [Pseudonaja textilis]|uniref:mucin-4 n=1 Tax=Pseudonaja textilis TaxID=8673 RepID=UPI000EA8F081|nr:mucin-4 [Pseudonaja textilis]
MDLDRIATGAALPVATEPPAIEDDFSTPNFLSTVAFADYFGPTLPTTTEEDLDFPAETPFPSEADGEDGSGSLAVTPKTFKIPEDLKEISEVPSVDKNVLHPVNSSQPTLGKESLQGDSLAESQEAPKKTPPLDSEVGHEATELVTERYSGVTEAPVTIFATSEEDLLASPSKEEAQTEILSTSPPEGEKPLENIPGEPNLDEEGKPNSTSWEETKASPLEAEKDTPEPSTDESGGTLEDPSSNPPVFPSTPEDLPGQETGENVDAPSLSSEGGPETSTGFPPVWPLPARENVGSPGINDLDVGSLQPSPAGVDSGSPVGRGDADPIPSSSSEPNQESPVNLPREEPEDILDVEAADSSPSDDAPSGSGPPGDTLVRTSPLDTSDIPLGGLSGTPEIPSQLTEGGEIGGEASTVKEEGENDSGNPKSDEGTSPVSPFPGQEPAQGTEIPDEERSEDLGGTASSLNPGVETANSELEDSEATTTSNSLPEDEINPIPSDLATGNKPGALFDTMVSSPPPVENEGADQAQEPPAEAQGSPAEASDPASTGGPSSETEGNEAFPNESPGNVGSSLEEVDTEATSKDFSPPDTEFSSSSGTLLPMERSGSLDDQLSPSQSLVENAPTSGSSSSSEGEPTFPSTSPSEALSGSLISEPDTTELPSNLLPGSQPSSQLPKENDMETGSGDDPEDSVSINGEEISSAPSIINPQPALVEVTEEPSISGDLSDGPILSPKEEKIGSTSEPGVDEEPLVDGDNTQHKFNASSSEQQLSSEDALDTSIPSSGNEPAVQSGTISPLVDTETSTQTQEPSAEKSSASIEDILPNSENEDGEPSPGLSSKTLGSSPGGDGIDESRDEEDDARSASSAQTTVATSNDGQPGSDFPVRQLVTSPVGGILALAPIEDGETSVPREDAQLSTGAVSSEDATPPSTSSTEETETSASEPSAVGSRPSPGGEAAPETSKETGQLQTSVASEKASPLASSTTESQGPTASESGEFSGELNHGSAAFPVEVAGTANSPPATDKGSQVLPEDVASSDGVEDSEEITNTISEKSSQDPLDRGSESKISTSEEDAEGRMDGELSLNNNRTETATLESANNGGSQLPPDGAQLSAAAGSSEISEGASDVNGKEGSLIPSAAELHSTSTSEEVENTNSESRIPPESKPSLDGLPTTEVQDSKSAEAVEDTSNNGEKLSWTLSSTASQSPGPSGGEDVSGGTDNGESSLIEEELETAGPAATNNAEAQPSVAGGATETSDVSNRLEPLENSSSANEGETSLGSSATESSTVLEDLEVSGKPSGGDGMEAVDSEPATNTEPLSSPNGLGPGGATVSEEAETPEVSRTSDGSSTAPEPQAISSSDEEETSNTDTNAGSQLPLDGESAAGTPLPNGAETSEVSSSVPEEKGPSSPSTPESLEDSSSTKELGTAIRKSTTDEGSQLSADRTSPEDSLAPEEAEPTESHPIASGDQASLVPPATELQFPETSANENLPGGLENGQSSSSPGEEADDAGSSNNVGSPDSVATEGEGAETPEDNSIVSEDQFSVAPSSTEPQSPGTSVSKDVSENLVEGGPSLSTDGGKEITNLGTAGAQGPTSSTGTGPDQNNIAEQFGENSDAMSGQSSVDGAVISQSSEETSISSSVSSDENLAAQGMSQDVGAPDSSQPSSDNQGNLANSIEDGSGENSVLGDHISTGDTLGVSNGPILEAGGEVLQGFSEALDGVSNLVHPSSAKGTKPAAGQLLGVVSPLASLPPKNGLLSAPSNLGGPKLGSVVGKGSSPLTLEDRGEVLNSILAVHKGISTASSADGVPPSLLGTKGSPAKISELASGKPGLQLIADYPLLSFNSDILANSGHILPGKPGPASSDSSSASDENDEDSSSGPNLSKEHQTLMKGKVALDLSKAKTEGSEPGVHLALSGVGLLAAKSSKPTGKPAKKKSDSKKSDSKKSDSKKSDSKKSKDKKTKPVENSAIMTGAPSGAAVSLYPYGAGVNDNQYVERKVDFNSPLFKPETGIPLGKSLRNSLYFTDNGQIVFPASDQDISSYPNPPSGGFNGREKVPMVAVFWDNADFSKGAGTIFYQEYTCGNSAKDPLVQDVEEKIRRYVKSSYRARWLLKVTWDKVQPYPAQRQKSKTNTYQAILTTDGYRTYALFLYQDGGMQWDYTELSSPNVLIGYTSGDGYFKNDNLMTRTPAEKYRPDRFQGYNTDVRGLWIYKLDSWIRVNYRQRCLDWLSHETLPSAWNRNLPPCPCFLKQAMSDNRYTTSQKDGELKLHDWCCNKAGIPQTCEKYDQKRPKIGCQGYKPSIWG